MNNFEEDDPPEPVVLISKSEIRENQMKKKIEENRKKNKELIKNCYQIILHYKKFIFYY